MNVCAIELIIFQRKNTILSMEIPFIPNLMSVLTATNVVSHVLRQRALDVLNDNGSAEGIVLTVVISKIIFY
jgi:hypothetical protein